MWPDDGHHPPCHDAFHAFNSSSAAIVSGVSLLTTRILASPSAPYSRSCISIAPGGGGGGIESSSPSWCGKCGIDEELPIVCASVDQEETRHLGYGSVYTPKSAIPNHFSRASRSLASFSQNMYKPRTFMKPSFPSGSIQYVLWLWVSMQFPKIIIPKHYSRRRSRTQNIYKIMVHFLQ